MKAGDPFYRDCSDEDLSVDVLVEDFPNFEQVLENGTCWMASVGRRRYQMLDVEPLPPNHSIEQNTHVWSHVSHAPIRADEPRG